MRILMLTSTLPRFPGDLQANFVREQADAWLDARAEARIDILAPHDPLAPQFERSGRLGIDRFRYLIPENLQLLAYPAILPNVKRNPLLALQIPPFLIAQYRAGLRVARQNRNDVIYAHWVMPQGVVARQLSRKLGIPFVLQNHSSDLSVFEKLGTAGRRTAISLLRDCDLFFCVNAEQLAYARSLLPERDHSSFDHKAKSIPMGFVSTTDLKRPGPWQWDIATMARLTRKKGLDLLIAAAERLAAKGIRPRIGIAGDGEERENLKALVQNADVTFTGFLAGVEKEDFLASARCHAFPAKASGEDREGMPVAMLEALASGRPVLASTDTNIEMLPEWDRLKALITFVSDPSDVSALAEGLEHLLQTPDKHASAASQIVSKYRWENLIEEYVQPIEELVR